MFERLKNWWKSPAPDTNKGGHIPKAANAAPADKPIPPNVGSGASKPKKKPPLTEKEKATAAGEPYVAILKVDLDPTDINNGSFDLDWNDKFLLNLVKQGYKIRADDTDAQIVDRWFQTVCRNIAMEVYEQEIADPEKRESELRIIQQRDIGNGRTEVS
jgi:hypothetical protein